MVHVDETKDGLSTGSGAGPYAPGAGLTVGATAKAVGVSVRTLHHWDDIGLVCPAGRSPAGYRLYSRADIARLQRVLLYREVGMPLAQIAEVVDAPGVDEAEHLDRQRRMLTDRIARLQEMVSAVDRLLEADTMDTHMTPEQQAAAFGTGWSDEYAQEAQERWGGTEDWKASEKIKARMTPEDWKEAAAGTEALEQELAQALRAGVEPGSAQANELAEKHRADIGRWFPVSRSKQVLIARGYTEDPRFTKHYDDRETGLAVWLRAIIDANARSHGVDPAHAEWE
jgi:DNA-binding transcriptional MerR regulator